MAKLTKEEKAWIAERRVMQKQFENTIGWSIPIRNMDEGKKLWSYTTTEPAMYLKENCELTEGLKVSQKRRMRYGIFVSEMLMVQFTDFDYAKSIASRIPENGQVFLCIANAIEKGAARRYASTFIGGNMLVAFKSMLKKADEVLPEMKSAETKFQEFMIALLHIAYTDTIKGCFKSSEVKSVMRDVYPLITTAIDCGDPDERLDTALAVMEKTKSIWDDGSIEAYSPWKKKDTYLSSLLGTLAGAISGLSGKGSGSAIEDDGEDEEECEKTDYSLGAKRESTWNKLNSDEEDDSEGEDPKSDNSKKAKRSNGRNSPDECEYNYDDEAEIDLSTGDDFDFVDEEEEIGCEDFLDDLIQRELEIDNYDLSSTSKTAIPDFQEVSNRYTEREYKCKNILVTPKDPVKNFEVYSEIVNQYAYGIKKAYKELDKIFRNESDEEEYRTSGKISMKKLTSGKVSSKMFTRKVEPDEKSSIALMVLVDESGSMGCGGRIERAKAAAIGIAETFAKLEIPMYVMGFTADVESADAVHYHYLQWHTKSKMDRATIASMDAKENNFDGYSIRLASSILSKRPETHKILMVISDGQPACNAYRNCGYGISDTIDAVNDARAMGQSVLGFGIGSDVDILKKFYQDDFIYIKSVEDLFGGMMKKLTDMVKSW